jgi:hypothetical protein
MTAGFDEVLFIAFNLPSLKGGLQAFKPPSSRVYLAQQFLF